MPFNPDTYLILKQAGTVKLAVATTAEKDVALEVTPYSPLTGEQLPVEKRELSLKELQARDARYAAMETRIAEARAALKELIADIAGIRK